jgi:hypothetical protein
VRRCGACEGGARARPPAVEEGAVEGAALGGEGLLRVRLTHEGAALVAALAEEADGGARKGSSGEGDGA